jgi:hypothetical protein
LDYDPMAAGEVGFHIPELLDEGNNTGREYAP